MSDATALNAQRWAVVRQAYDDIAGDGGRWNDHPLYAHWQFRMRAVLPSEVESNQYVDWDGYDIWDSGSKRLAPNIFSDEIQGDADTPGARAPVHAPESARATLPPDAVNAGYFGPPRPSHGVVFDARGTRYFVKRIKCVIGWNLADSSDIYSGERHVFYFSVYNPDARKGPR
jgi:hypothetical protein